MQPKAVCFYQNEIADGMDLFMANVAKLGTNRSTAPLINPIFDAIEYNGSVVKTKI